LSLQAGAQISITNLHVVIGDVKDDRKALQLLGFDGDKIPVKDEYFAQFEGDRTSRKATSTCSMRLKRSQSYVRWSHFL